MVNWQIHTKIAGVATATRARAASKACGVHQRCIMRWRNPDDLTVDFDGRSRGNGIEQSAEQNRESNRELHGGGSRFNWRLRMLQYCAEECPLLCDMALG